MDQTQDNKSELRKLTEGGRPSLLREFWDFLKVNKKWWLAPILVVVLFMGLLVLLSGSAASPFIYTLF